jgi:hypothetical protein
LSVEREKQKGDLEDAVSVPERYLQEMKQTQHEWKTR